MDDNTKQKLFVGSISWNTTEDQLKDFFSQVGTVESCVIIKDRMSGKSKGFAFVVMSTEEEAQKAIDELDGKELDGRQLVVNKAKPREPRHNQNRNFRRDH